MAAEARNPILAFARPALLFAVFATYVAVEETVLPTPTPVWWAMVPLVASLAYGAGAIWWTRLAVRAPGPSLLRIGVAWLPSVVPVVQSILAQRQDDNALIAIGAMWPYTVVPAVAALVATWSIVFRPRDAVRQPQAGA